MTLSCRSLRERSAGVAGSRRTSEPSPRGFLQFKCLPQPIAVGNAAGKCLLKLVQQAQSRLDVVGLAPNFGDHVTQTGHLALLDARYESRLGKIPRRSEPVPEINIADREQHSASRSADEVCIGPATGPKPLIVTRSPRRQTRAVSAVQRPRAPWQP